MAYPNRYDPQPCRRSSKMLPRQPQRHGESTPAVADVTAFSKPHSVYLRPQRSVAAVTSRRRHVRVVPTDIRVNSAARVFASLQMHVRPTPPLLHVLLQPDPPQVRPALRAVWPVCRPYVALRIRLPSASLAAGCVSVFAADDPRQLPLRVPHSSCWSRRVVSSPHSL